MGSETSAATIERRCGTVVLVGRPNVGKSTLFNALVGQHLSITAAKPQTTRYRIMGVRSEPAAAPAPHTQFVFLDSPGFQLTHGGALNQALNRTVQGTLDEADVVAWVVEAGHMTDADSAVARLLTDMRKVVLVANKVDRIKDKQTLLPWLHDVSQRLAPREIVPVSARAGTQLETLLACLRQLLPVGEAYFEADRLTDGSERFFAAELVREQLFRQLGEEIPFSTAVAIESFREEAGVRVVHATILVAKENHKAIVIGKGGARLKQIGTRARGAMEQLFGARVRLETWVKVKHDWSEDARTLRQLGHE